MTQGVPTGGTEQPRISGSLVTDVARRSLAERERVALDEIRRLIDAGIAVLSTSSAARVADIVSAAGLSNSAFYRYFSSKDELILAILQDGSSRLASYLAHRIEKAGTPREQVAQWVTGVLDQARNPSIAGPTRALLAQRPEAAGARVVRWSTAADRLREPLTPAIEAMGRRSPERDSVLVSEAVVALLLRHLQSGAALGDEDVDHAVCFVLAALDADDA